MSENGTILHNKSVVVDAHSHLWDQYIQQKSVGKEKVFDIIYAPRLRQGGVSVVTLVVGGDHVVSVKDSYSDLLLWNALSRIDMLLQDEVEGCESFILCRSSGDIDNAIAGGKIAVLLALEGGRPLEGKPSLNLLSSLRVFYRLGVRSCQLVGNGRNRLADGTAQARTKGGLTRFGRDVVKEMNRLGMVIDVAHLIDQGFWDVLELSSDPVIDSHSNARAVCDHPRNISDERIKAMAENGGVIGLNFYAALVNNNGAHPTIGDLIKHINHIAELVGVDHIALGPNFSGYDTLTPIQLMRRPGFIEGVNYGLRESDYISGADDVTKLPLVTEALVKHGYSDEDIKKILGDNFLRLYKQVLR
jgi:membrane dipeptidase